jgi:hypothetical protein
MRDNFKPRFAFQQWDRGEFWNKKLKKHFSRQARYEIAVGGFCFTKKSRAETPQPGLDFVIFKPRLESGMFKTTSWLNGLFFGNDDHGFLEEEVKTYLMAPMYPQNKPTVLFFPFANLLIYSPWRELTMTSNK